MRTIYIPSCEWQDKYWHVSYLKKLKQKEEEKKTSPLESTSGPGALFSKVPKSHNKNHKPYVYRAVLFHTIIVRTKLTSMQSLLLILCFLFEIEIIENGFTGPIGYRVFRETGPGIVLQCIEGTQLPARSTQRQHLLSTPFDNPMHRYRLFYFEYHFLHT